LPAHERNEESEVVLAKKRRRTALTPQSRGRGKGELVTLGRGGEKQLQLPGGSAGGDFPLGNAGTATGSAEGEKHHPTKQEVNMPSMYPRGEPWSAWEKERTLLPREREKWDDRPRTDSKKGKDAAIVVRREKRRTVYLSRGKGMRKPFLPGKAAPCAGLGKEV